MPSRSVTVIPTSGRLSSLKQSTASPAGDVAAMKALLRDYIKATAGFEVAGLHRVLEVARDAHFSPLDPVRQFRPLLVPASKRPCDGDLLSNRRSNGELPANQRYSLASYGNVRVTRQRLRPSAHALARIARLSRSGESLSHCGPFAKGRFDGSRNEFRANP
jgi:hypothetical protein